MSLFDGNIAKFLNKILIKHKVGMPCWNRSGVGGGGIEVLGKCGVTG
jgi:hypothetical protein